MRILVINRRRYVASWTVLYGASRKRFLQKSTFLDVVRDADTSNDDVPRNLFKTLSVFHQPSRHEYYYLAAQSRSLSRVLRRGPLDTHANNESIRGAQSVRQHWQPPVRAPVPPLTETGNGRNARSTTDWSGFRTHAWRHWYCTVRQENAFCPPPLCCIVDGTVQYSYYQRDRPERRSEVHNAPKLYCWSL